MQRSLFDFVKKPDRVAAASAAAAGVTARAVIHADQADHLPRKRPRSSSLTREGSAEAQRKNSEVAPPPHDHVLQTSWLARLLTEPGWQAFLQPLMLPSYRDGCFSKIEAFLSEEEAKGKLVLPPRSNIFAAFNCTPLADVKVVLLGQDPYHDVNQAHGLCFSVLPGVRPPPSLKNMYKELAADIGGFVPPQHGYLQSWAAQGMLMLNSTLTVEAHKANSHSKCGWQLFTDDVIRRLSRHPEKKLVFLLWGNFAKKKKALIDTSRHVVIECAHPSPLSATHWFGCRCFSKCNAALEKLHHTPMNWHLPLNPSAAPPS